MSSPDPTRVADRLHSAAIHLLRRLRREDAAAAVSAARLSALSVLVFAGPLSLGDLARAEQVRPPTMSRMVAALEVDGLVRRQADPADQRVVRLRATAKGNRLLQRGRRRRIQRLAALLGGLRGSEVATLAAAAGLIERILNSE